MSKISGLECLFLRDSEGVLEQVAVKEIVKNKFKEGFHIGTKEGCMILAQADLTASEYKVMMVMIGYMDYENYVFINQKFLADTLKIAQPNISRTVSKLLKKCFIFKEERNGINCFRVNAHIAWKGKNNRTYRNIIEKDGEMLSVND